MAGGRRAWATMKALVRTRDTVLGTHRRSQRGRITWARMGRYATRWLPQVRVMHPYPNVRFAART
jgi:hypothetical protein